MAVERQFASDISPLSGDHSEKGARRRTRPNSRRSSPPKRRKSASSQCSVTPSEDVWHTAKPHFVFSTRGGVLTLFLLLDFLIYLERGIVPGAHEEIAHFLVQDSNIRKHPEVYFGLLQSVFIAGLAITAPILSYLAARTSKPVPFLALGLGLWAISIFGCSVAGYTNSISMLFVSRALSGAGEGAFIGLMAPVLLDCNTESQRGTFLGLFYGLMPAGMALGFITSAVLAAIFKTWYPAFGLLFLISTIPIMIVIAFALTPASHGSSPFKHLVDTSSDSTTIATARASMSEPDPTTHNTSGAGSPQDEMLSRRTSGVECEPPAASIAPLVNKETIIGSLAFSECLYNLLMSPMFLALLLSGASQAAVSASLASFGSAFLLDLGVFPTEVAASSMIGIVGACTGALGTFAGGLLTDYPLQRIQPNTSVREIEFITYTPPIDSKTYRWAVFLRDRLSWAGEEVTSQIKRIMSVKVLTPILTMLAFIAAMLLSLTPFILHIGGSNLMSLSCLTIGLLCLFMTQSGLNYCVMSCAPHDYRSLAISVFTLGLHLVGDVPGPIAVGYLKDHLAPHCSQPTVEDGDGIVSILCQQERGALLLTLFIFLSWSHCIWIGVFLASKVSGAAALPSPHPSVITSPINV